MYMFSCSCVAGIDAHLFQLIDLYLDVFAKTSEPPSHYYGSAYQFKFRRILHTYFTPANGTLIRSFHCSLLLLSKGKYNPLAI